MPVLLVGKHPGAAIVVPNVHVENMNALDRKLAGDVHETARLLALAMKSAYGCNGISTRQHNEPDGLQEVWHYTSTSSHATRGTTCTGPRRDLPLPRSARRTPRRCAPRSPRTSDGQARDAERGFPGATV